ncbi:hypothetical protein V5N11_001926 [Cardamine amara subsp. amara]|uniref:J domain-containing protein n=1 Tax=Cardamine amara subsp. amara TaxID=228776 RepID=A0ABD1AJF6_CARAN
MNTTTIKAAIFRPQSYCSLLKTAFFHSTPVLERKRRSSSSSDCLFSTCKSNGQKKKRSKKFLKEHQEAVHRAVEEIKREREEALKKKAEEAKKTKDAKEQRNDKHGSESWRKRQCCEKDFEYLFRNLFSESRNFYYSNHREEEPYWWYQSSNFFRNSSWRSKYSFYEGEEEEEKEEEDGYSSRNSRGSVSESIQFQASHRQTLGLSPWGPLKLEDVKHAYRTCALKWHPDRHDESTKAVAEAKFKLCSVAYQSLIEKLAVK